MSSYLSINHIFLHMATSLLTIIFQHISHSLSVKDLIYNIMEK